MATVSDRNVRVFHSQGPPNRGGKEDVLTTAWPSDRILGRRVLRFGILLQIPGGVRRLQFGRMRPRHDLGGIPKAKATPQPTTRQGWVRELVVQFCSLPHPANRDFAELQIEMLSTDKNNLREDIASYTLYLGNVLVTELEIVLLRDLGHHGLRPAFAKAERVRNLVCEDGDADEGVTGKRCDAITAFDDQRRLGKEPPIKFVEDRRDEPRIVLMEHPFEPAG